jgi:hypothetical protein
MNTKDPFNDPLVKSVREVISEQEGVSTTLTPQGGSIALNYVDISNPDNPVVVFRGAGSMPYEMRHKDIGRRLKDLGENVAGNRLSIASVLNVFADK